MSVTTSRVPALASRSLPEHCSHLAAAKLTLVQHAVVFSPLSPTWGWSGTGTVSKFVPLGAAPRISSGDRGQRLRRGLRPELERCHSQARPPSSTTAGSATRSEPATVELAEPRVTTAGGKGPSPKAPQPANQGRPPQGARGAAPKPPGREPKVTTARGSGGEAPRGGVWGLRPHEADEETPGSRTPRTSIANLTSGAEGNRTPDLLDANESRYQLRHSPRCVVPAGPGRVEQPISGH